MSSQCCEARCERCFIKSVDLFSRTTEAAWHPAFYALDLLVEPLTRGDPMSPLRWTCKSRAKLTAALTAQGWRVSSTTVGHLRATSRRREIAIRLAMGAGRGRLIRLAEP